MKPLGSRHREVVVNWLRANLQGDQESVEIAAMLMELALGSDRIELGAPYFEELGELVRRLRLLGGAGDLSEFTLLVDDLGDDLRRAVKGIVRGGEALAAARTILEDNTDGGPQSSRVLAKPDSGSSAPAEADLSFLLDAPAAGGEAPGAVDVMAEMMALMGGGAAAGASPKQPQSPGMPEPPKSESQPAAPPMFPAVDAGAPDLSSLLDAQVQAGSGAGGTDDLMSSLMAAASDEAPIPGVGSDEAEAPAARAGAPERGSAGDQLQRGLVGLEALLDSIEARPDDVELLVGFRQALAGLVAPVRRLGFKTFGTLAQAVDETLAEQLQSSVPPPEGLPAQLRSVVELLQAISDGRQSRIRTYYEQVAEFERMREEIEASAQEDRERRRAEFREKQEAEAIEAKAAGQAVESDSGPRAALNEVQEIFLQEMKEHLDSMTRNLLLAEQAPANRDTIFALMRSAHSIKGSAAIAKFGAISRLAHAMEDVMVLIRDHSLRLTPTVVDLQLRGVDLLQAMGQSVEYGRTLDETDANALGEKFRALATFIEENLADFQATPEAADARSRESIGIEAAKAGELKAEATKYVNVDIRQLDGLMNLAADLVINRTRLATQLEEIRATTAALGESKRKLGVYGMRLKRALEETRQAQATAMMASRVAAAPAGLSFGEAGRKILTDFESEEFDRFSEVDVVARDLRDEIATFADLQDKLAVLCAEMDQNLSYTSAVTNDLHESITRTRMIPVGQLFNRFPRAVRDLAQELGKGIEVRIAGGDTPLDKTIIEEIADPLMHLVRNAADHGIEASEDRVAMGKPPAGTIRLSARQAGNQVIIEVSDDGGGIDLDRIRDKAIERGFMTSAQAASASEQELYGLLMRAGFSTAQAVTAISGRGVGLDVVADALKKLEGTLTLTSTITQGTTFTLRLPMTLAITQALIFEAGEEHYALPLNTIDEIVAFDSSKLHRIAGLPVFELRGSLLPLVDLKTLFGVPRRADRVAADQNILVLGDGADRAGLVVDRLKNREEVVVKSLGGHLRRIEYVFGATVLGDGRVTLLLDAAQIVTATESARSLIAEEQGGEDEGDEAGGLRAKRVTLAAKDLAPSGAATPAADAAGAHDSPDADAGEAAEVEAKPAAAPAPVVSSLSGILEPIQSLLTPETEAPQPAAASAQASGVPHVLVVDDSVSIRRYVAGVLEAAGLRTTMASDGVDALAKLSANTFDLIVTDLEMPRMHGYELVTEIRSGTKHRNTPIIILTGRMGEKHSRKGLELGANAFMVKPFEEPVLIENVRRLLPAWRQGAG